MAVPCERRENVRVQVVPLSVHSTDTTEFDPFWLMVDPNIQPRIYNVSSKIMSTVESQMGNPVFFVRISYYAASAWSSESQTPQRGSSRTTPRPSLSATKYPVVWAPVLTPCSSRSAFNAPHSLTPDLMGMPVDAQQQKNVNCNNKFPPPTTAQSGATTPVSDIGATNFNENANNSNQLFSWQDKSCSQEPMKRPSIVLTPYSRKPKEIDDVTHISFQRNTPLESNFACPDQVKGKICRLFLDGVQLPDKELSTILRDGDKIEADIRNFESSRVAQEMYHESETVEDNICVTTHEEIAQSKPGEQEHIHQTSNNASESNGRKRNSSNSECDSIENLNKATTTMEVKRRKQKNKKSEKNLNALSDLKGGERGMSIHETIREEEVANNLSFDVIDQSKIMFDQSITSSDASPEKYVPTKINRKENGSPHSSVIKKQTEKKSKNIKSTLTSPFPHLEAGSRADKEALPPPEVTTVYDGVMNDLMNKRLELLKQSKCNPMVEVEETGCSSNPSEVIGVESAKKRRRKRKKNKHKKCEEIVEIPTKVKEPSNFELNLPDQKKPQNCHMVFEDTSDVEVERQELTTTNVSESEIEFKNRLQLNTEHKLMLPVKKNVNKFESAETSSEKLMQNEPTSHNVSDVTSPVPSGKKTRETVANHLLNSLWKSQQTFDRNETSPSPVRSSSQIGNAVDSQSKFGELLGRRRSKGGVNSVTQNCDSKVPPACSGKVKVVANGRNVNQRADDYPRPKGSQEVDPLDESKTPGSTVMKNKPEAPTQDSVFELTPVYSLCATLDRPPRKGDVIAYKILEMTEDYTPAVSDFKEAKVISYNPQTCALEMEPRGNSKPQKRTGRFELQYGDSDGDDHSEDEVICLCLKDLLETRLVSQE